MNEQYYNLTKDENPAYLVENRKFYVMRTGQQIILPYSMFLDTLEVVIEGSSTSLTIGSDLLALPDDQAMSIAKCLDPEFDETLVKVLEVNMTSQNIANGFPILISGYAFETPYEKLENDLGQGPIPTPGLMAIMLQELNFISSAIKGSGDTIATLLSGSSPKEYDPLASREANRVVNEIHYVNVHSAKTTIIPSAGDFYINDFQIKVEATGQVLEQDIDYAFSQFAADVVEKSASTWPAYKRIVIKAPIVGNVLVTYRAVGGTVTYSHYGKLASAVGTLTNVVNGGGFVTTASLHKVTSFQQLQARITALETSAGICPNYQYSFILGDANQYHWYTIGEMGFDNTVIVPNGQTNLEIRIPNDGNTFNLLLTYNLSLDNPLFNVEIVSSTGSPLGTTSKFMLDRAKYSIPKLRVVYYGDPSDPTSFKGARLQLGYRSALTAGMVFSPIVANRSHLNRSLTLYDTTRVPAGTSAKDDSIVIVDGSVLWQDGEDDCYSLEAIVAHAEGQAVWYGTQALNDLIENTELDTIWDDDAYRLGDVRSVEFLIRDRFRGAFILVSSSNYRGNDFVSGSVNFHTTDLCSLRYALFRGEDEVVHLNVSADIGPESMKAGDNTGRFELHRIAIKF